MRSPITHGKPLSKPSKPPATPNARGQWLVLIGGPGETSADDIEAFFADLWPVQPDARSSDDGPGVTVDFRGVH